MKQLHNSLIIFTFFKEKFERDLFLIEASMSLKKKYGKKCTDISQFSEDLEQSIFLKQVIDVCAFLDEFKAFRALAKDCERVRRICGAVKPALERIEGLKGLRAYRNALAAHNFREGNSKDEVVLLSDYTKNQDHPNSISEMFFLSSLCITIIEKINEEFNGELQQAWGSYKLRLEDVSDVPLRGVKTLREAYDEIEKYRIKLNLKPMFTEHEFTEINMALSKLNWNAIPKDFQLGEEKTNKAWCEVLGQYFQMRGYRAIEYYEGTKGSYTNHWLEFYGYAITITNKLECFKPSGMRRVYSTISNWEARTEENASEQVQLVYDELMKVVTP